MSDSESGGRIDIDGLNQIRQVVELAMKGSDEGDRAKLEEAYHPEARMFGEVNGTRYDDPIAVFFSLCEDHKLGAGGRYRSTIVSVTQIGGAAMVMVAEDGCWGTASFVDFFTVSRTEGAWKITNKTFSYTGGEIPPEVTGKKEP
jgi:hypothetical protein